MGQQYMSKEWKRWRSEVLHGDRYEALYTKPIRRSIWNKIRLWRIQRALGIKLWPEVRKYVWGGEWTFKARYSGKTIAANVFFLMWYRGTVDLLGYSQNLTSVPDWYKNTDYHKRTLLKMQRACEVRHIDVVKLISCK
jgi:hypothetical protein